MIENFVCRLTNTRYADDILLYGKSLEELIFMSESLIAELRKVGLRLNTDKTKILHTPLEDDENTKLDYIEIDDGLVQILHPEESHRYLGRFVSMSADLRGNIEFNHRKQQAWAAFHKHKHILLNQNVSPNNLFFSFMELNICEITMALCGSYFKFASFELDKTIMRFYKYAET